VTGQRRTGSRVPRPRTAWESGTRLSGARARLALLPAWVLAALRWALGIGILAILLASFDASDVLSQLRSARLELAIPAIAGLVAIHLVGATTWRLLAKRLSDQHLPWPMALWTYYVAQGLGGLTPGNLGADAYRVYAAPDGLAGWRRSLRPIAVQRVTSSAALAMLAVVAVAWLPASVDTWFVVVGAAVVLAVGSSLLVLFLRRPRGDGTPPAREPASSPGTLPGSVVIGLVLGAAFHAGAIGLSYVLVAAVTPISDPGPVLACLAIARLSILVPISPSGLGFQEGALSFLFVRIGLSPETALAAALLNRVALLATVALGGVLLALGAPRSASRHAPAREGSSLLPG
jgi:uncharacterized membrane protein YbhN (UPF0104 family)